MAKTKVRTFRVELAICLAAPVLVLAVIAIPGYGHIRKLKADIAMREFWLNDIPAIEHQLAAASRVLASYRVSSEGKDKVGELSLMLSRAATEQGVTVKSVMAEKSFAPETPYYLDYRIPLIGEGKLGSVVRTMDGLDQPVQCLRVSLLRLKGRMFQKPRVYDVEWVYQARFVSTSAPEGKMLAGKMEDHLATLNGAIATLETIAKEKKRPLDTGTLDKRDVIVPDTPVGVMETPISFRLTGIVRDGNRSLALTDRGVVGVGDSIDGYEITAIGNDGIVVESPTGRKERVFLYKNEAKP